MPSPDHKRQSAPKPREGDAPKDVSDGEARTPVRWFEGSDNDSEPWHADWDLGPEDEAEQDEDLFADEELSAFDDDDENPDDDDDEDEDEEGRERDDAERDEDADVDDDDDDDDDEDDDDDDGRVVARKGRGGGGAGGAGKKPAPKTASRPPPASRREDKDDPDDDGGADDSDDSDDDDEADASSSALDGAIGPAIPDTESFGDDEIGEDDEGGDKRRGRRRSKTIARKQMLRERRRMLAQGLIPEIVDYDRPKFRAECRQLTDGDPEGPGRRPCLYVSCRYHLYLDVNPVTGSIKLNFPDKEVWALTETCALDVAERGGITLEEVGEIMNLTRERIRQVEVSGLEKLKKGNVSLKTFLDGRELEAADAVAAFNAEDLED